MNFKEWVTSHNPRRDWDWDNPENLKKQLIEDIRYSGEINIEQIWRNFFLSYDPGLTLEQASKWAKFAKQ